MIFDVRFKTLKDRKNFETKYTYQTKNILVGDKSNSGGFISWRMMRDPNLSVVYFAEFMGYADPLMIVNACKKKKIGIKFFAWIPINDKNSQWEKLVGRW